VSPFRLGPYEVRAKIGEGGMATVFVGRRVDGSAGPAVAAIKMVRDQYARSGEFVTMFLDEAKIVSALHHPNIVRYFELGREGAHLYLAMELLLGQSLFAVWEACRARKVRLRYDMIAWVAARVAEGLHHAHGLLDEAGHPLGIVHRDVNATNVFLGYDGQVKVIDFGLAKATHRASRTAAGVVKGKVAYMSPEQAVGGAVDRRTDVFSLGIVIWELGCDRRLFRHADEVETLRRVHAAEVPDPTRLVDDFPPELGRIALKALARDPDGRYPTAAAMAQDLDAFVLATGAGMGAGAVADVLGALFGEDRGRQRAWVADASRPDANAFAAAPLKPRTTFWDDEAGSSRRRDVIILSVGVVLAVVIAFVVALAVR
jgi:eukaryotic-like serine/threonine-protein kinase